MTSTQTKEINKHAEKIKLMDKNKLSLFVRELYMAKSEMNQVVFKEILARCDYRMAELKEIVSVMVVVSERSAGEMGL